ncbi:MAG: hypothetical protein LBG73_05720 [Spirochaetaceae bacterium]|jgi:hypothetical protein|nr:hypothetical protein [Spirochaetaceae bacterium]
MVRKRFFSVYFLFFCFCFLSAQEYVDFPQRVRVLYRFEIDEDFFVIAENAGPMIWEGYPGPFPPKETWTHTFLSMVAVNENVAQIIPASDEADLFTQAVSRSIPVFIHIRVSGSPETAAVQIRYTLRAVFSDYYTVEDFFEAKVPLEDDLVSHFWIPLNDELAPFLDRVIRPPVRIEGPVGTLVYGFSKEPVLIPEAEYVYIDVPLPGTYSWKMVHKRYVSRTGIFFADRNHLVLTLPRDIFSFSDFLRAFDGDNRTVR